MRLRKALLFLFILPFTLFLDLILFGLIKTCASCSNFWQWVGKEGALSFPIVVGLTQYYYQLLKSFGISRK